MATDILIRLAVRHCDRIMTISEFSKNEILRYTSARSSRITVTPLAAAGVFARKIPGKDLKERLRHLLPGVSRYILSVANSYPHKNLHLLANAFASIGNHIPHYLVIVGKPRRGEYT